MRTKYIVRLTDEERASLMLYVAILKGFSQKSRRAQMLRKAELVRSVKVADELAIVI